MASITFYFRNSDDNIEEFKQRINTISQENGFELIDICLDDDPSLAEHYDDITPSLQIGPYRLKSPFEDKDIQIAISAYRDHEKRNPKRVEQREARDAKLLKISALDRFSYWLSNHYELFITAILIVFLGVPFLAPVFLKSESNTAGQVIYKAYSIFCHQLSFRSYFLYGEQVIYPRELAHIENMITYETATGKSSYDTEFARSFEGNSLLGYKVALCERDIAIYGTLALGGLIFYLTKRKIKHLPWYLWVIFAILPIALDGGSQLFSLGGNWPAWVPIRESTPLLRTITGSLFGLGTAWYVYPMMEESMVETRSAMARKLAIKKRLIKIETSK
jgi:uncharacterized membrane protein